MTLCCYTSILLALHCAQGSLLWTIDQKITHYGETLTLLCHVPNCCPKYAGWDYVDQNGTDHTLFIDIKSHKKIASAKHDGEVKTNGYTLIIRNLTKQDLNISYKCVYDSTIGDPLMLLEQDVFKAVQVNPQKSEENDNLLIIFIVVFVALVILVSLVTIVIWVKRSGFVLAGICWTHGNVQQENDDVRQNDVELGEALLKHKTDNANIELMTNKGNNVADYQTREISYQCPTFSPKPEEPRESVDSGCHEENISDIVVNNMYADHKSSTDSVFCKDDTDMYDSKQHDKNTKDSLTSSVSSINDETKSEHDSGRNIRKLSMDFSAIQYNTNNPVTVNSEHHTFQLFSANVQEHQGDTSGYQTQSEQDAAPSTTSQSGEYMSMNVSTLNSRNDTSETIPSNLENFNFEIKGLHRNNSNSMSGQSETDMKHAGPNSVDSGVYNI